MPETRGARVARFNLSWIVQGGEATGDGNVPAWAAAAAKSDGYYGKTKVVPKAEVKAHPFDLGRVKLLPSPFERAMKINQKYLLPSSSGCVLCYNNIAAVYDRKGELGQAAAMYERAQRELLRNINKKNETARRRTFGDRITLHHAKKGHNQLPVGEPHC